MKRTALALTLVLTMLVSAATGILLANFALANFVPQEIPPPSIVINSDGTVEGANIHRIGNVYTLTGNAYGKIAVLRDDIVIDGAGYALQGYGDIGIFLQDRSNVTIMNMNIRLFEYGIKFTLSYGAPPPAVSSTISGNTITNNTYGIYIDSGSASYVISKNHLANNTYGISIAASGNLFRNNNFENNKYSILDNTDGTNDIDTSNTVNGKPIYYWVNQHDRTVPSDAGFVALKDCRNITVQNLKIEGNGAGILLYHTTDSTISENIFTNNLEGITLKESCNNLISGNNVTINQGNGIGISVNSNSNVVSQNEVTDNEKDGVNVETSINNTINENSIVNNEGSGIFFSTIQDSNAIGNNITLNHGYGIRFENGPNGMVKGNYFLKNQEGMLIKKAFENTVTLNTISESNSWCIDIQEDSQNNTIYHNNFNNKITDGLQVYIAGTWTFPAFDKPHHSGEAMEPPKFIPGAFNAWDDGKQGNYWSDYKTRYPFVFEIGNTGIGNIPFVINENNIDNHPFMTPLIISNVNSSSSQGFTIAPSSTLKTGAFPTAVVIVASVISVSIVSIGLLVFFKKRKH